MNNNGSNIAVRVLLGLAGLVVAIVTGAFNSSSNDSQYVPSYDYSVPAYEYTVPTYVPTYTVPNYEYPPTYTPYVPPSDPVPSYDRAPVVPSAPLSERP